MDEQNNNCDYSITLKAEKTGEEIEVRFLLGSKEVRVGKKNTKLVTTVDIETYVDGRRVQYPPATNEDGNVAVRQGQKNLWLTDESVRKWENAVEKVQEMASDYQLQLDSEAE